jgi:hypothetical protein
VETRPGQHPFMTTNKPRTRFNSTIRVNPDARPPKRKTAVKKRRPDRIKKRREECYGKHAADVRGRSCFVCEKLRLRQTSKTVAAHAAKTTGAGGKAKHICDLCMYHEALWHSMGPDTFDHVHGVNCKARAAYLWSISPHNPDNISGHSKGEA